MAGQRTGRFLVDSAQRRRPDDPWLSTFAANRSAQAFYLAQGFVEIGRGMAAGADNPSASSVDQLADVTYRWRPASARP